MEEEEEEEEEASLQLDGAAIAFLHVYTSSSRSAWRSSSSFQSAEDVRLEVSPPLVATVVEGGSEAEHDGCGGASPSVVIVAVAVVVPFLAGFFGCDFLGVS